MTQRIIKDFSSWKLFEADEAPGQPAGQPDPIALYNAGDRKGLMALAEANDSPEIKAKPGYQAIINWWKQGHGDLSFWKSIVKDSDSVRADASLSLKSAFYWGGSSTNVRATERFVKTLKKIDTVIAAKAKIDAWIQSKPETARARYSTAWIDALAAAKPRIEESKAKGLLINNKGLAKLMPDMLAAGNADNIGGYIQKGSNEYLAKLASYKATPFDTLVAQSKDYFEASISLSEADKLAMLDDFAAKAQKWANQRNKRKPNSETLDSALAKATSLFIAPTNVNINVTKTTATATNTQQTQIFSYPDHPMGNENSEAFKKGLQMFPDDGIVIGQTAKTELTTAIKEVVAQIKEKGGEIIGIKTYAWASTSKVPTKYGSESGTYNPENNVKLVNDRLGAINAAIAAAVAEAGIAVKPTVDAAQNTALPNQGPDWGPAQRNDSAKYGVPGKRTELYEKEYGIWRFAMGFFELTYQIKTTPPIETKTVAAPSGKWKSHISWADESFRIEINIPSVKIGTFTTSEGPSRKPNKKGTCPGPG